MSVTKQQLLAALARSNVRATELEKELASARKTAHQMEVAARRARRASERDNAELHERLRMSVAHLTRITQLLRSALPADDQIGVGADGMVQSLLARMNRLAAERDRAMGEAR